MPRESGRVNLGTMLPVHRVVEDSLALPAAVPEISEPKLQAMIESLHDAPDPIGRRNALRIPVEGFVEVEWMGEPGSWQRVGVYDMSRTGIAIVRGHPYPTGEQLRIMFTRGDRRPIEVMCTVRHSRPHGNGYIIGAEFGVSWLSAVASAMGLPA